MEVEATGISTIYLPASRGEITMFYENDDYESYNVIRIHAMLTLSLSTSRETLS